MTLYEIQHHTLCQGWISTWTDDDENPCVFATRHEAETALQDYIRDCQEAVERGDLAGFDAHEYRIAEATAGARPAP